MNFKLFIEEQEGLFAWLAGKFDSIKSFLFSAFGWLKRHILASVKVNGQEVSFSFPSDFSSFFAGASINEGYRDHKYGKGGIAFDSISQSKFATSLNPQQSYNFQRGLTAHIKDIAKEMGLIFELELYAYMLNNKKLITPNPTVSLSWAQGEISKNYSTIKSKTGDKFTSMLVGFITHHATDLAENIFKKAESLLNCTPDTVVFTGGNPLGLDKKGHRVTSDLILKCNGRGRNQVGFTTKFTGETDIRIGDFWINQMYAMFGGKKISWFKDQLAALNSSDMDSYKQEYRDIVLSEFEKLLNDIKDNRPKLNFIINKLLFGTETDNNGAVSKDMISDVLPAFKNYVYNRGNVDFTPAIKRDFDVSEEEGMKLKIKKGAEVQIHKTAIAVLIKIKNPEETKGTFIKFEVDPRKEEVMVKMNNLT